VKQGQGGGGVEQTSEGSLLGGRLVYRQFLAGHRSGFEPVLLAAAVPARAGDMVLEAGTGAGAALLCLAARVPGISGVGLEIDPALARLSNENFKINGLQDIHTLVGDATRPPFESVFNHVMANPPWHPVAGTASPDQKRALAHQATPGLIARWIAALAAVLKPRGSITLILPATALSEATAALQDAGCGGATLLPLWPRASQPAKLIILSARRRGKAADKVLSGLVLHDEAGISPAAQAILRDGAALTL
jgi:tRNA1(Val) A37 N6-methylase TrmN6